MPARPLALALEGTVLVTGASSGIGEAIAGLFAAQARRLILVARRQDRLEALAASLRAKHRALTVEVLPCDLSDSTAVDALLAAAGDVDVLVNNAGMGDLGLFEHADTDKLERMIGVNVVGLTRLTRGLVPGMVARGRGGVLMVSSSYGLTWTPGAAAYIGTKHYVTSFAECLRSELAPAGITVTQLCPGPVETEFEEQAGTFFEGIEPPRFVFLSAGTVARAGYRGLLAGKAIVVPGLAMKVVMFASTWTPRWVLRFLFRPMSIAMRRHRAKRLQGV